MSKQADKLKQAISAYVKVAEAGRTAGQEAKKTTTTPPSTQTGQPNPTASQSPNELSASNVS